MLATLEDFRFELTRVAKDIDDRDLEDGAGQVILALFKNVDDRIGQRDILTREDLSAAMRLLSTPPGGDCRLEEGHLRPILTAFRLLWAGHYRELVLEEKHCWGEKGYRAEAIERFRRRVFEHTLSFTHATPRGGPTG